MVALSEQGMKVREALMWKITTHDLTLQELLIMTAMNVASALIATDKGERKIWRSRAHRDSQDPGDGHGYRRTFGNR
jgi:hypothetical protein